MAGAVGTSFPAAGAACGPGRVASAPRAGPAGTEGRAESPSLSASGDDDENQGVAVVAVVIGDPLCRRGC